VRRREAAWPQHLAARVEESETGFRRPAALRASLQAPADSAMARRWVPSQAVWRRRALPSVHRAAAWAWLALQVQRAALLRMEAWAAACAPAAAHLAVRGVPAEQRPGARAAVYGQAEPRLAEQVRGALPQVAASDARAVQPREVAEPAETERQREAGLLAAQVQQPVAVVLDVPVRRPEAAVPVALEPRPAAREDVAGRQGGAQPGVEAMPAASARRPAVQAVAAAWASRPGRLPPSVPLVRRRAARLAHVLRS
jgi:hypothetical protein